MPEFGEIKTVSVLEVSCQVPSCEHSVKIMAEGKDEKAVHVAARAELTGQGWASVTIATTKDGKKAAKTFLSCPKCMRGVNKKFFPSEAILEGHRKRVAKMAQKREEKALEAEAAKK